MAPGYVPPAVYIELRVESAPRVLINAMNSGEEERIWDWIGSHDELAAIVEQALELAQEQPAA